MNLKMVEDVPPACVVWCEWAWDVRPWCGSYNRGESMRWKKKKLFFNIRYKYRQFLDNVKKYPASSSSKRNKTNLLQHNSLRQSLNFDKINTRPNSKFWRPSEGAKRLNVVMYIKPRDWYLSFFVFSIDHQRCVLPMWIYGKESSQTYFLITDANSRAWILYLWLVVSRVYNKKTWHKHE